MTSRRFALAAFSLSLVACSATPDHDEDHAAEFAEAYEQELSVPKECSGMRIADEGNFGNRVALTFDDGPNPQTTPLLLDILAAHDIKATFFVVGYNLATQERRDLIEQMKAEGHLVGNHTQNHKNSTKIGLSVFHAEVTGVTDVLLDLGIVPDHFRFPYGSSSCSRMNAVKGDGYLPVGWTTDSGDWCFAAGNGTCKKSTWSSFPDAWRHDMIGYTLSQIELRQGGVVLMHDVHSYTVNHVEQIIDQLTAHGYSFVRIDDLATFPATNARPSWVGSACASDSDCLSDAGHCLSNDDGHGFCTMPCEGYCPDAAGVAKTFCVAGGIGSLGGHCVSRASSFNLQCSRVEGTEPHVESRYVGQSGATPTSALVCVP